MGRRSTKENKNQYQISREKSGLTREKAGELLDLGGWNDISPERIERIESGKCDPTPYDAFALADIYSDPSLCNYHCTQECKIGQKYAKEITEGDLPGLVVSMISSLNDVISAQERLISISADGKVDESEIEDFKEIQRKLDRISANAESLRFWMERTLSDSKKR